jgi:putative FmdB family regulatory protein
MPTYEYACSKCGHRFDVRQSFSEDPINDCPECGASVRRVLYPAGVIFKGSGWYATDNRRGSASHTSSTSSPSTETSSNSSSESTEAPAKSETPVKDKKAKSAAADD